MDELTKKKEARRSQARLRKLQKKKKKLEEENRITVEEILAIADPEAEGGEGNDMGKPPVEKRRAAKKKQTKEQSKAVACQIRLSKLANNLKLPGGPAAAVNGKRNRNR